MSDGAETATTETETAEAVACATPRRSVGPRRSDATHCAVLDAAERLLLEGGPSAVTFEAVARAAGAGKPTLYRWWRNRSALLLEVHRRHKDGALPIVDRGGLEADLLAFLTALWGFWREAPAGRAYAAVIAEAQCDADAREALVAQFSEPGFPLTPIFERAVVRGEITAAEAVALKELVIALNWLRLLTRRLDTADLPGLVAGLLGPRGRA